MTPEELLRQKEIEGQFADHCEKIFDGMFRWCTNDEENPAHVVMMAFKVDRQAIALKALENVLNKYKEAGNERTQDQGNDSKDKDSG